VGPQNSSEVHTWLGNFASTVVGPLCWLPSRRDFKGRSRQATKIMLLPATRCQYSLRLSAIRCLPLAQLLGILLFLRLSA